MKALIVAAVAALTVTAAATAQDPGMRMGQGNVQQCLDMMGGAHPAMLLHAADSLGLSADQRTRLEALRDRANETATPHMQPAMQAHHAAAELLRGDAPDYAAYEAKLREAVDHMVQAHMAMARTNVEARQVLTAEQQARVGPLLASMMQAHAGGQAMAGMGQRDEHGMGGMMMHCMMMGASAPGQHQGH